MKKRIAEVTFEEFDRWCNERACDGNWSALTALFCIERVSEVLSVRPIFGRRKAREVKWNEIKAEYFNCDAEIEL